MKKIIIANWKMNPSTLKEAIKLARASDKKGVVVAPPFVFTEEIGKILKKAELGAQDVFWKDAGPYTSEVSWRQLKKLGVKYIIIGHSERRALGETDATINKKLRIAFAHGLKAILCVGEPKRELGIKNNELREAKRYVKNQLKKDLAGIQNSKFKIRNSLVVAYEPVWAIGTGKNDTPKDASEMANFIKRVLKTKSQKLKARILYGGSVKAKNAKSFFKARDIDGLLVGGASLKIGEFRRIIKNIQI